MFLFFDLLLFADYTCVDSFGEFDEPVSLPKVCALEGRESA